MSDRVEEHFYQQQKTWDTMQEELNQINGWEICKKIFKCNIKQGTRHQD